MIQPKIRKPTRAEEKAAYLAATERDEGRCVRCGSAETPTRDHRKNRSQGGRTEVQNLQVLCGSGTTGCHGRMTSHPAEAERDGFSVPQWGDPAEWPGRRLISGDFGPDLVWVLYTRAGDWFEISHHEARRRMSGDGRVF